ncbi:KR domain-containing protein, partial [Streptomyces sp. NPDC038707]|uniref:KR domain-containing protein n=1 Tax=Streptomyces sp. NPDC038707 TaxID=3154329 RepID=UPI0033E04B82
MTPGSRVPPGPACLRCPAWPPGPARRRAPRWARGPVTGGTGALGGHLARRLARQGAEHIVLAARR